MLLKIKYKNKSFDCMGTIVWVSETWQVLSQQRLSVLMFYVTHLLSSPALRGSGIRGHQDPGREWPLEKVTCVSSEHGPGLRQAAANLRLKGNSAPGSPRCLMFRRDTAVWQGPGKAVLSLVPPSYGPFFFFFFFPWEEKQANLYKLRSHGTDLCSQQNQVFHNVGAVPRHSVPSSQLSGMCHLKTSEFPTVLF